MAEVWGCRDCGKLVEERGDGTCGECGASLTGLGGDASPDKAAALIAFARRDATHVVESIGAVTGAVLGAGLAAVPTALGFGPGELGWLSTIYGGICGAVLGRLFTWPVYRLLKPKSRLQPLVRPEVRRVQIIAALALVAVPLGLALLFGEELWRAFLRWLSESGPRPTS